MSTQQENAYIKVRNYIRDNPDATIIEICEQTKVPFKNVISLVRDGDFILKENENSSPITLIRCESCGVKLLSGHYCKICERKLSKMQKETKTGRYYIRDKDGRHEKN